MMTDAEKRQPNNRRLVQEAINAYGVRVVALRAAFVQWYGRQGPFKHQIPLIRLPQERENQGNTGRCWLFAFNTVMLSKAAAKQDRSKIAAPLVPLSANHLNRHSLRARVSAVLREVSAAEDPKRELHRLVHAPSDEGPWQHVLAEGGLYHWAAELVRAHGILPDDHMRVSVGRGMPGCAFHADDSEEFLSLLRAALIGAIGDIAARHGKRKQAHILRQERDLHTMIDRALGKPPRTFREGCTQFTPHSYRKSYLELSDPDLEAIPLIFNPRLGDDTLYRRVATQDWSAIGMPANVFYNVPPSVIRDAVRNTVRDLQQAVWVSTSHGFQYDHPYYVDMAPEYRYGGTATAVVSPSAFDYTNLPISSRRRRKHDPLAVTAKTRGLYGISPADHAMAIVAYDPPPRRTKDVMRRLGLANRDGLERFRALNSWGEDFGNLGCVDFTGDGLEWDVNCAYVPRQALDPKLLEQIEAQRTLQRSPIGSRRIWANFE